MIKYVPSIIVYTFFILVLMASIGTNYEILTFLCQTDGLRLPQKMIVVLALLLLFGSQVDLCIRTHRLIRKVLKDDISSNSDS